MADLSKLNGYAVTGAATEAATVAKFVAYAVTGAADPFETVSKLVAYAVVVESTGAVARPQVFVCT